MEGHSYNEQKSVNGWRAAAVAADLSDNKPEQLGITPRALQELFARAASDTQHSYYVACSYVQLYRDQVYDLLLGNDTAPPVDVKTVAGRAKLSRSMTTKGSNGQEAAWFLPKEAALKMRYCTTKGFYVEGLTKHEVTTADEALKLFRKGIVRKVGDAAVRALAHRTWRRRPDAPCALLMLLRIQLGGGVCPARWRGDAVAPP